MEGGIFCNAFCNARNALHGRCIIFDECNAHSGVIAVATEPSDLMVTPGRATLENPAR